MIDGEIHKLGPFSQGEKMVLLVFLSAAFLWVVPGVLASIPGALALAAEQEAADIIAAYWTQALDRGECPTLADLQLAKASAEGRAEVTPIP